MRGFSLLAGALFASCLLGVHSAALRAQPVTPAAPIPLLTGTLTSTGTDTLASLMSGWAADFSRRYPEVGVQIQAMGSAAAAAALVAGTAQLGPMSRPMSEPEIAGFRQRYGYAPLTLPVAQDALVVMVNQANPLEALSQRQRDAIFSVARQCGQAAPIRRWGDVRLSGEWRTLSFKFLDPLTLAFLARLLSAGGQEQVSQAGYVPLTQSQRLTARRAAGLP